MREITKGRSPFYPGQPVPVELFVGRQREIDEILTRGAGQVALGKPIAIFVEGDYGIGKSSIAKFTQLAAKKEHHLAPIYSQLSGAKGLNDVASAILKAAVDSVSHFDNKNDKLKEWVSKYIEKTTLLGFTINMQAVKDDAAKISTAEGILKFLSKFYDEIKSDFSGLFLVIDEINGIANNPEFAHFLKGLVDLNAMQEKPLPLLLMLCGVADRRRALIQCYEPIARIFEVIDIDNMTTIEMEEFFSHAFEVESRKITPDALRIMTHYSAGVPKIMHMIGDQAYWIDQDGIIDKGDASQAVVRTARDFGRKYFDEQIISALGSVDYRTILDKLCHSPHHMSFTRTELANKLSDEERPKLDNFIQRMKKLKVIHSDGIKGEYLFNSRMIPIYIWLRAVEEHGIEDVSNPRRLARAPD